MLQTFFLTVILLALPLSPVFAEDVAARTATIQVDGLSCPFCAYGLEKNLKKVAGIGKVAIDMKTGKAVVTFRPEMHVADKILRQAVKKAGFTARDITRN